MKFALIAAVLALSACDVQDALVAGSAAPTSTLAPYNLPAFFDCLRENSRTIDAAHRGGPAPGFAENSVETFANTVARTPAILEIDIARTRDNELVLMHDDELDRTTTGAGLVREHTLAEIQALRLRDNDGRVLDAHPPTLREALDWALGKAILEVDVKRGVSYEDVIAEVRAADAMGRVVFITYSDDAAVRVHGLAPEMMLSISVDEASDIDALERRGIDLSRMLAWTGTEEPNAALNVTLDQRGVETIFGTLGNPERSWDGRFAREGREQYAAFADTGLEIIATDRPVEASRELDANDGADGLASLRCAAAR
ncbi:glycerophosphodiester phosphodiesterase family protein [Terricaulis silvestris]|uniref:Putative glycerophosphoryl diester phosphodiesterase 1 n=1 Tax=Terricaulis silvestris TaxID=2686094 RepID=A0A6I6MNB9_9CAUL|nr:glycerophosphodiester phosphodiesterase family protein [Terricaulis silvestris]QGZ97025.1 putative glycerophosphoryl diester phosphodiesterase 1 [Terricaulis silvestris]